jgi:hypothetical protein
MSPTPFPDLNAVLAELAERAAAILGTDFVGAYLQGSFAVGDADRHTTNSPHFPDLGYPWLPWRPQLSKISKGRASSGHNGAGGRLAEV